MDGTVVQYLQQMGAASDRQAVLRTFENVASLSNSVALSSAALAIKTGGSALAKNGSVFYAVAAGKLVTIAANTDMPALTGMDIAAGKYNVVCFFIDSAGTVTAKQGTEGSAIGTVKFPDFPVGKALVGALLITYASAFVGGTTALDTATTVYLSPTGAVNPTLLFS